MVFAAVLLLLLLPWYFKRRRRTAQKTRAAGEENGNFRQAPYEPERDAIVSFLQVGPDRHDF